MNDFNALMLTQSDEGATLANFETVEKDKLPDGDVLVKILYSSLNYKDGLAVTGTGKIVRGFPMIPGIDFVGTVEESASSDFQPGDTVVLTGWGVGEKHWGGFAQYARVKSEWLVPLVAGISAQHAMAIGTAGFTAMMAVMAIEGHGVTPADGEVLVTGASGGAGSMAIAILAARGYTVVASTGREELTDYVKSLGASEVVGRFSAPSRPLGSVRWAAAVDTVGGDTLANILSVTQYSGSVASLGLAGGTDLNTTVFPFVLRGVNLLGIDSVMCPLPQRKKVWDRLSVDLPTEKIDRIMQLEPLSKAVALSDQIVRGQIRGRVVLDVNK